MGHHPQRIINNDEDKWLGIFSLHDFEDLSASPNEKDTYALQGAGVGAVKALQVTLADDDYLYEKTDFSITEAITDYYGWDGANYVMSTFSFLHLPNSDKYKRKAFWEWWLLDAIPQAYHRF